MGEAKRTTKVKLDFSHREEGGNNTEKRENLDETAMVLNEARKFYVDFFLEHREKLKEKVTYYSEKYQEERERKISADELLTWAESKTIETKSHPDIEEKWNFKRYFSEMPFLYRRSVIKDAIGKVNAYLSNLANYEKEGQKKGKPGIPSANNHPTLYKGLLKIDMENLDYKDAFIQIKVYESKDWIDKNYRVEGSRWLKKRLTEKDWKMESPKLILKPRKVEIHIPQCKKIEAKTVQERKQSKDLITIAVDLNVKNLAVISTQKDSQIIETVFFKDKGLDQHRYRHTKEISKKQWQSGKTPTGERSNNNLWEHIHRTNEDFAHKASSAIAKVCEKYPESVLIFENLRKFKNKSESKSHRLNRKLANQIRGKIRDYSKYKAFFVNTVTVEVNPHGTSRYCCHCGAKGERFSLKAGQQIKHKGGKLFHCSHCGYTANADFNASVNLHHSFYKKLHWSPRQKSQSR